MLAIAQYQEKGEYDKNTRHGPFAFGTQFIALLAKSDVYDTFNPELSSG
jgi:hypothetical protein